MVNVHPVRARIVAQANVRGLTHDPTIKHATALLAAFEHISALGFDVEPADWVEVGLPGVVLDAVVLVRHRPRPGGWADQW